MESSIKCPICLDILVEATVLRCGHSFCQLCLDGAVNIDDRCPECRRHTEGILISNLRLNECIYHIIKENSKHLEDFSRRKARNAALMKLRKEARAVLFSILYKNKRPLTQREIEDDWMATRQLPSFPDNLRAEVHQMIHSDTCVFQIIRHNDEHRVMLKNFGCGIEE
ncbi:RING-type domain-containing protein [Trichostrongylus colubriformis]|uniref:RING-type domain-containing protein n=1 Tax=Trichostrongylus colubriformis TaxID=6319 RepID=A0AAN8FQY6_TRICO